MASVRIVRALVTVVAPAAAIMLAVFTAVPDAMAGPGGCTGSARRSGTCTAPGNQPPTISGTPSAQATVGQAYTFTPSASDPEGKSLGFSVTNKPPWATFSASTGRLSGTPPASAEGEHADIVIQVSDGRLTSALAPFSIVVSAGNQPPSIAGTPPAAARVGQVYEFQPSAADVDGDPLSFTIANRPFWATFDPQTGRLSGTPGAGSVGVYRDITIRVSDGNLISALPSYSIAVEQTSLGSATLSWVAPTRRDDGTTLTNLAGYRIRYGTSPGSYPNQLQIPNPGITACVVENLPPGTYFFVATAYDSNGAESEYSGVVSKTIG